MCPESGPDSYKKAALTAIPLSVSAAAAGAAVAIAAAIGAAACVCVCALIAMAIRTSASGVCVCVLVWAAGLCPTPGCPTWDSPDPTEPARVPLQPMACSKCMLVVLVLQPA